MPRARRPDAERAQNRQVMELVAAERACVRVRIGAHDPERVGDGRDERLATRREAVSRDPALDAVVDHLQSAPEMLQLASGQRLDPRALALEQLDVGLDGAERVHRLLQLSIRYAALGEVGASEPRPLGRPLRAVVDEEEREVAGAGDEPALEPQQSLPREIVSQHRPADNS